jgi:hypothetical protein
MRRLLRTTGLAILGLVLATLLVEVALRAINASPLWRILPVPAIALYGPDPFTGYRHRPNVKGVWVEENRSWIVTSNLGLRDRNRSFTRGPAPRVVVVGNSVLEALQVDLRQTGVYVAEQLLQRRYKGAEVINLGLAGASPPVEVARLQSLGVSLRPDVAVVVLPVNEFFSPIVFNDREFTGYGLDADGRLTLHFGFRASSGYRFRTSRAGAILYWLLDHSEVMRIYNARKNAGLFAEWPRRSEVADNGVPSCFDPNIARQLNLWRDHDPPQSNAVLDAVIRDLSAIQAKHDIKIVVAQTGMASGCPDQASARDQALAAMNGRLAEAGLRFADFDGQVAAHVGPANLRQLRGFGATLGRGHLNVFGNHVYGEILAQVVANALVENSPGPL